MTNHNIPARVKKIKFPQVLARRAASTAEGNLRGASSGDKGHL
nr:MAG TPA: hypothetical protein [Caudoviricetes sp.]